MHSALSAAHGTPCSDTRAVGGDAQDLAGTDVAHVGGAHDVEGAGFGRHDPAAGRGRLGGRFLHQLPQHERADAVGVAERVERLLVDERHGVAAAHEFHGFADALAQMVRALGEVADEFGGDLGVGIGEEGHAQLDELATQLVGVDERAVVRERDDDVVDGGEVRLRGLPALGARGTVAHVAHGELAGERGKVGIGKDLIDEAEVFADHHRAAVAHRDAADSWPRCCSAFRPKYVRRATSRSGAHTPKTPHSSWRVSSEAGGDGGAGCGARGFLNHSYLSDAVNDPHIMARRHAHGTDSEDVDRFLRRA